MGQVIMTRMTPGWLLAILLCLGIFLGVTASNTLAQETSPRLFITSTDVSSPPSIELHVYGVDGQGLPLDLQQEAFLVEHNKAPAIPAEAFGIYPAGTFTLFLIDIPTGVSDQLATIQDAIIQYASSPTMMEQVDYVAVFQVGRSDAIELLPPTAFYNGVRNLFATPLTPESGVTALVDSMTGVLEQMKDLMPRSDMVPSMVVITDGTDVVSTRSEPEDVGDRAVAQNIPIHTIWLDNSDLSGFSQEQGQSYLNNLASRTNGVSTRLEDKDGLTAVWDRIASYRNQTRIRYTVSDLTGGTYPVEVMLTRDPAVRAETNVTIAANSPSIMINLPLESRALTLPNLDEPVELRFSTSISWLDGVERQITAAQLVVNELSPISIPVDDIDNFHAEISELVYGDNTIQIAVLDEQGMRVTSPLILLTVTEGPRSIPDELRPTSSFGQVIGTVALWLVIIAVLAGTGFMIWRGGWLSRLPTFMPRGPSTRARQRTSPQNVTQITDDADIGVQDQPPVQVLARLDVLGSVSRVPAQFALGGTRIRIGRSPTQTEITFENDITVSRVHASLMLEGDHYRIFDERSTSGTWVNEQQVPEYGIQLTDGDEIHLGAVHLRFRQPDARS